MSCQIINDRTFQADQLGWTLQGHIKEKKLDLARAILQSGQEITDFRLGWAIFDCVQTGEFGFAREILQSGKEICADQLGWALAWSSEQNEFGFALEILQSGKDIGLNQIQCADRLIQILKLKPNSCANKHRLLEVKESAVLSLYQVAKIARKTSNVSKLTLTLTNVQSLLDVVKCFAAKEKLFEIYLDPEKNQDANQRINAALQQILAIAPREKFVVQGIRNPTAPL